MIDQSFLDLFDSINTKEGFYLWLFMLLSFLFGFLIALLLRWSRIRSLKKEIKALKVKEQNFDANLLEVQSKLNERNLELQEASREKVDLMDRLSEMDEEQQKHLSEVYEINQQVEGLQNTNRTYVATIDDLNNQIAALRSQNEQLTENTSKTQAYSDSSTLIDKEAYAKMQERLNSFEASLTKLSTENSQLRNDLQTIKKKDDVSSVVDVVIEEDPKLQIVSEKTVLYDKIVADDRHRDDLTKIEGIGDFISKKLNSIGVFTYEDIAEWNSNKIEEITVAIEYLPGRIQKDDWVGQAAVLLAGSDHEATVAVKKRKPAKKTKSIKKAKPSKDIDGDDLKIIEGIGPKIAEVLNNADINNWATLAATEPGRLKEILEEAGGRFKMHTPYTWPLQARLAAAGRWDELKEYQKELKGGKE